MKKNQELILAEALAYMYSISIENSIIFVGNLIRYVALTSHYIVKEGDMNNRLYIHFNGNVVGTCTDKKKKSNKEEDSNEEDIDKVTGLKGTLSWIANQIQVISHLSSTLAPVVAEESIYLYQGSTVYYIELDKLKNAIKHIPELLDLYDRMIMKKEDLVNQRAICMSKGEKIKCIQYFHSKNPGIVNPKEDELFTIPQKIIASYFYLSRQYYCATIQGVVFM